MSDQNMLGPCFPALNMTALSWVGPSGEGPSGLLYWDQAFQAKILLTSYWNETPQLRDAWIAFGAIQVFLALLGLVHYGYIYFHDDGLALKRLRPIFRVTEQTIPFFICLWMFWLGWLVIFLPSEWLGNMTSAVILLHVYAELPNFVIRIVTVWYLGAHAKDLELLRTQKRLEIEAHVLINAKAAAAAGGAPIAVTVASGKPASHVASFNVSLTDLPADAASTTTSSAAEGTKEGVAVTVAKQMWNDEFLAHMESQKKQDEVDAKLNSALHIASRVIFVVGFVNVVLFMSTGNPYIQGLLGSFSFVSDFGNFFVSPIVAWKMIKLRDTLGAPNKWIHRTEEVLLASMQIIHVIMFYLQPIISCATIPNTVGPSAQFMLAWQVILVTAFAAFLTTRAFAVNHVNARPGLFTCGGGAAT